MAGFGRLNDRFVGSNILKAGGRLPVFNRKIKEETGVVTPPVSSDPYFDNVSLLLHMDGSNGSTTFTDSSINALTVTANGNAQISTAQSKFGGASGLFDGNNDYLTLPASANFAFGTDDYTVELFVRRNGDTAVAGAASNLIDNRSASDTSAWLLYIDNASSGYKYTFYTGGSNLIAQPGNSTGSWVHIALVRNSGVATLYIDGNSVGSASDGANYTSQSLTIGGRYADASGDYRSFNGYIDDLRITKGVARYTANFTPPTAPFPDSSVVIEYDPYYQSVSLLVPMSGTSENQTFTDFSTNTFGITTVGDAQISSIETLFQNNTGRFDGSGDRLVISHSDEFNLTGDFTIEMHVRPLVNDGTVRTLLSYGSSNTDKGWVLQFSSTGITMIVGNGGVYSDAMTRTPSLVGGVWQHLAITRSGTTMLMFVDGVQLGGALTTAANLSTTTADLWVGMDEDGADSPFVGHIANLRITKGVARYTGSFTPPTAPFPTSDGGDPALAPLSLLTPSLISSSYGNAASAFDSVISTKWVSNTTTLPISVDLSYSTPVVIKQLGFTTADEPSGGDPLSVSLQARNSVDASWVQILSNNYLNPPLGRYTDYPNLTVLNDEQYYYYRLFFPSVRTEGSTPQISEIRAYGDVGVIPPSPDPYFNNVSLLLLMEVTEYQLNNEIYSDFEDSSLNELQITREGSARHTDGYKKFGLTSGIFSGVTSQLRLPTDDVLNMGTDDFTVEGWIRLDDSYGYVFQTGGAGNSVLTLVQYGVYLELTGPGIEIRWGNMSGSSWNYFAVTRKNGEIFLYVNGNRSNPKPMTGPVDFSQAVIGGAYSGTFPGVTNIDDFQITREIARYSDTNFVTPTASFVDAYSFIPIYKDPNFSKISLLLPLTGLDGETNFEDTSLNNLTVTNGGGVEVSDLAKKFADGTALFPGTSTSYLSVPAGDGFNFGDGDFTIETWVRTSTSSTIPIYSQTSNFGSDDNSFKFGYWEGAWNVLIRTDTDIVNFSIVDTITTDEFFHIALCREGSIFRVYKNGIVLSFRDLPVTLPDLSGPVYLGTCRISSAQQYLSGFLDEVRVTKGAARYLVSTSSYGARPGAPFSDGILTTPFELTNQQNVLFQYSLGGTGRNILVDYLAYNDIDFSMYANHFQQAVSVNTTSGSPSGSAGFTISANASFINPLIGSGVYTLEFYFKLSNTTQNSATPLIVGEQTQQGVHPIVGILNGGPYIEVVSGSSTYITTGPAVPGVWYHLVVCRDGDNVVRIFLDGALYIEFIDSTSHNYYTLTGTYYDLLRFTQGEALYTSEFNRPTVYLPPITETLP